uniref:Uncharacterized protein n=1 Tax=viral metagenome TaxID=1070528 RepID=A0A6M3J2Z8_9ZZZZ
MANIIFKQAESESVAVSSTAIGLTPSKIVGAVYALCTVETANVRIDAYNTPTSSSGILISPGERFNVWGADLFKFKAIRAGSVDATLQVLYYKVDTIWSTSVK